MSTFDDSLRDMTWLIANLTISTTIAEEYSSSSSQDEVFDSVPRTPNSPFHVPEHLRGRVWQPHEQFSEEPTYPYMWIVWHSLIYAFTFLTFIYYESEIWNLLVLCTLFGGAWFLINLMASIEEENLREFNTYFQIRAPPSSPVPLSPFSYNYTPPILSPPTLRRVNARTRLN